MAKQINPIETAITDYLKAQGITFVASGGIATKLEDWDCDLWTCVFNRAGKNPLITNYHTGVSHRVLTKVGEIEVKRAGKASAAYIQHLKAKNSVAVAPHVAGVLHSLLLDSDSAEQSFHDWCDCFGYDKDSIKAQSTYNACCDILTKMRSFFTGTERTTMQEILQDY